MAANINSPYRVKFDHIITYQIYPTTISLLLVKTKAYAYLGEQLKRVDMKDGGAKSPASVYGMASQLGFAILPDLFFAAPPMKSSEVDRYVDSLDFNRKVKEVLKRKLYSYLIWKEHTYCIILTGNYLNYLTN